MVEGSAADENHSSQQLRNFLQNRTQSQPSKYKKPLTLHDTSKQSLHTITGDDRMTTNSSVIHIDGLLRSVDKQGTQSKQIAPGSGKSSSLASTSGNGNQRSGFYNGMRTGSTSGQRARRAETLGNEETQSISDNISNSNAKLNYYSMSNEGLNPKKFHQTQKQQRQRSTSEKTRVSQTYATEESRTMHTSIDTSFTSFCPPANQSSSSKLKQRAISFQHEKQQSQHQQSATTYNVITQPSQVGNTQAFHNHHGSVVSSPSQKHSNIKGLFTRTMQSERSSQQRDSIQSIIRSSDTPLQHQVTFNEMQLKQADDDTSNLNSSSSVILNRRMHTMNDSVVRGSKFKRMTVEVVPAKRRTQFGNLVGSIAGASSAAELVAGTANGAAARNMSASTSVSNSKRKKQEETKMQFDLDQHFLNLFRASEFSAEYNQFKALMSSNHQGGGGGSAAAATSTNNAQSGQGIQQKRKTETTTQTSFARKFPSAAINLHLITHLNSVASVAAAALSASKEKPEEIPLESGEVDEIAEEEQGQGSVSVSSSGSQLKLLLDSKKRIEQCYKCIEEDNFRGIMPYLKEFLSKVVDVNDLPLFTATCEFMADLAYEMNDDNAAMFFYNQSRIIHMFTHNHSKKARMLLCLAKCARGIYAYHEAKRLLKKAIQYAWLSKENNIELEIYDEMGRNFHYQGNIEKAKYYHDRFTNASYEADDSPTKLFSEDNLRTFLSQIQFTFTNVTSLLLAYLNTPIFTLQQLPQYGNATNLPNAINGITPRSNINVDNQIFFEKSTSKSILKKILQEDEFYIEIQSPLFQVQKEEMELGNLAQKRLNKLAFRQQKQIYNAYSLGKVDREKLNRDFSNPFKYKLPLEKKIEYLAKQKIDPRIDDKLAAIRLARFQSLEEGLRNRVYSNSLFKAPKQACNASKPITSNYKNIFKEFIQSYITQSYP